MIKNFVNKVKATKKVANEKNVHNWYNCVFHSVILILVASLGLSLLTMNLFIDSSTPIGEIPLAAVFIPLGYGLLLSWLFLEKLILLHIKVFELINKYTMKAWQKLDMYWFRKYRKHSPLTEGLSKLQNKASKIQSRSPRTKKLIIIGVIAGLILLQVGLRAPILIDILTDDPEPIGQIPGEDELQMPSEEQPKIIVRGAG